MTSRPLDREAELFGSSASEILRFIRSTRPRPPVEDVEAHLGWLDREGLLSARDRDALAARGYRLPAD